MKLRIFYFLMILLTGTILSCRNLKHIHDFATASNKAIEDCNKIPYSYVQYCRDSCNLEKEAQIQSGAINFNPLDTLSCNCTEQQLKDIEINRAYTVLTLYFSGLEKLSDNKKFVYQTGDLVSALGKIKAIKDPKLTGPVSGISDIIFNMATHTYRSNALRRILDQSKEPVDQLLKNLVLNNQILEGKYDVYYNRYLHVVIQKYTGKEPVPPKEQLYDYIANRIETEKTRSVYRQIENSSKILNRIRTGHLKLADEKAKLNDKELIIYLYTQANELKSNISKIVDHE